MPAPVSYVISLGSCRALFDNATTSAAWSKPEAVETQIGLLPHDLVVVVVVQDTEPVIVGQRGDDQIDRREPVVSGPSELALSLDRSGLHALIDRDIGERHQVREQSVVIPRVAC